MSTSTSIDRISDQAIEPGFISGAHSPPTIPPDGELASDWRATTTPLHSEPGSVLVVEDDTAALTEIYDFLSWRGLKVFQASRGHEAFELFSQNPDIFVVVSDVHMPGMSGIELLDQLQDRFGHKRCFSFIVVTGHGDLALARSAMRLDTFDFLPKPVSLKELYARVVAGDQAAQARGRILARQDEILKEVSERGLVIRKLSERMEKITANLADKTAENILATRTKDNFLSLISHELRTPFNAILGFSELAKGRAEATGDDKMARYLDSIFSAGTQALEQIDMILDLISLDSGQLTVNRAKIAVSDFTDMVIRAFLPKIESLDMSLDWEISAPLPYVHGDKKMLTYAFAQILSNAIKFSSPGSDIKIAVREHGPDVWVSVVDQGPGLAPQDRDTAIQDFAQLSEGYARTAGGLGLGLALAHRVLKLHDGKVEIDGQPGLGTSVSMVLPGWHGGEEARSI